MKYKLHVIMYQIPSDSIIHLSLFDLKPFIAMYKPLYFSRTRLNINICGYTMYSFLRE